MENIRIKSHKDYTYFVFVFFLYFFIFKDFLEQIIPFINYSDELISLFSVPIFLINLRSDKFCIKLEKIGYGKFIFAFFVIGTVSTITFQYQNILLTSLPDAFICLKFWFALYVGKFIFKNLSLKKYAVLIYRNIKIISLFYLILILTDWVFNIFRADIRYGLCTLTPPY